MAGYTRQSVASIINGANITAPPLNAEFNQILAAFNASTGHSHDGSTGNAPKIDLTTSLSGYLPVVHGGVGGKNNTTATTDPTTTDDNTQGYAPGSIWINASTGYVHLCLFNTTSNANWVTVAAISNTNIIAPKATNTVDIGTSTLQFKNIYADGIGYIDDINSETMSSTGNTDVGGNLSVTGNGTVGGTFGVTGNTTVGGTATVTGNVTASANLSVGGNTTLTGTLSANGNVTLGNAASDTVTFTADVASDLIPSADGTHSLGAVGSEWQDLFIDGTANIDSLVADTADINAGSIDGTVLGAGSPASASFTGLTVSSTVNFNGATVSDLGSVTTADINGGTIDGVTIGTNSAVTDLRVDNLKVDGNAITSTNSNGNIDLTPAGTGEVNISKVDIDSGAIDGTTIGSSSATSGAFTTVSTSGQATLATVDINGGTIDGTAIGSTTTASGAFTTVSASGGFTGAITGNVTGNVTGNLTGNVTGNVTGDVTGDLTGNVTASTGTSTFENVVVNGTANFTSTALTNVVDPTNLQDAATKNYVDTQLAGLVDSAPGALDTLNELAAALGDDPNFSTTITNSIATKLPLAGGTMSGAIAMGTSKITGLGNPTANQDATTKTYVDTQRDTRLATVGGTMTGDISIGTNKITTTADPTNANDLARKSYVDTIHGSAVAAATSATNSANSATASANSATASANSASASASSAASAAASYDLFDDRFLGAKSSAPTVDNDGDALVIGSLYFDTTAQIMKVYGSSGWQSAGSAVNGTSERFKYTATSNQTTFSGNDDAGNALGYDAGFLDVYLSGVKLVNGTDFTATSGTSVQLVSGAATGDILEIVTYGTFVLSNQSLSDMQDVNTGGVSTNDVLAYNGTNFVPVSTLTGFTATGLTMTGAITTNSTIDGRDVATDGTKLDGIEASADVTDTANVTAAGALMDSELTAIASVKALNQGVSTTDDPTFTNTQLAAIAQSKSDTAVDVFVYDTSKDSDGGAWRKRTQATSWYNETLNTTTRGSRKEFPSVAVIVLQEANVTIYDGDDPSLPLWMRWNNNNLFSNLPKSVAMLNGFLVVASNHTSAGYAQKNLITANFITEEIGRSSHASLYGGTYYGGLSYRESLNNQTDWSGDNPYTLVNFDLNDVAMTVLPNAPIDASTGLPVPTIAVATNGGVSVIKDDGSVVDITHTSHPNILDINFRADGALVYATDSSSNARFIHVDYKIPSSDLAKGLGYVGTDSDEYYYSNTSTYAGKSLNLLVGTQQHLANNAVGSNNGLNIIAPNRTAPTQGLISYIASDYNTGWMNGDIKLATLSDTDTTNVTGSELVTNGTFAGNLNNWDDNTSGTGSVVYDSGTDAAKFTRVDGNNNGLLAQGMSLVSGQKYVLSFDVVTGTNTNVQIRGYISSTNTTGTVIENSFAVSAGNSYGVTFVAPSGEDGLEFRGITGTNTVLYLDNISVCLAEEDRSVNGNGLQVFGTVTKNPVATGADLVAYSGFTTSNYLRQPYNADLNVGTGDICVMGWAKNSGGLQRVVFDRHDIATFNALSGASTNRIYLVQTSTEEIDFTLGSTNHVTNSDVWTNDGIWHQVVCLRRNGVVELWFDGKLQLSEVNTTAVNADDQILIFGTGVIYPTAPWGGSLALWRISATAPSPEQIKKIYNDEKHLFQENAQATLYGTSDAVIALAYDDDTELLHAGTSAGRSVFQGLRRVENTTDAVGSAISASNGLVAED